MTTTSKEMDMSRFTSLAAMALLGLASATAPAWAQDRHDEDRGRGDHPRYYSERDEMRQSRDAMRHEATAAFAEAKRDCARRGRHERNDCLRQAREDYDREMAEARRR